MKYTAVNLRHFTPEVNTNTYEVFVLSLLLTTKTKYCLSVIKNEFSYCYVALTWTKGYKYFDVKITTVGIGKMMSPVHRFALRLIQRWPIDIPTYINTSIKSNVCLTQSIIHNANSWLTGTAERSQSFPGVYASVALESGDVPLADTSPRCLITIVSDWSVHVTVACCNTCRLRTAVGPALPSLTHGRTGDLRLDLVWK